MSKTAYSLSPIIPGTFAYYKFGHSTLLHQETRPCLFLFQGDLSVNTYPTILSHDPYFVKILEVGQADELFEVVCHLKVFYHLNGLVAFRGFHVKPAFDVV